MKINTDEKTQINGVHSKGLKDLLIDEGNNKHKEKTLYHDDGTPRRPRCDGLYEELPEWQQDNELIKSGYRIDYEGPCEVASTICKCHNETVNVWTHLVGSLVLLTFTILVMTLS